MHRVITLALCTALGATALDAQQAPRRPRLGGADPDTNDAAAYFQAGLDRILRDPAGAADAFYWAARLDPMSPQALYARGVAQVLRDNGRLVRYMQRDARVLAEPRVRAADSLRFRAEMQDPFLHRGMDELLLYGWARNAPRSEEWFGTSESAGSAAVSSNRSASLNSGLASATERFLQDNDQAGRGILYYSQGDLRNALNYLTLANRNREEDWVWQERARVFAEQRQLDSAIASIRRALQLRGGAASDDPAHHVYEASAAWHFAMGRLLEDKRDTAGARLAYQASLQSDAAYYPAQLRLGTLALQQRDTATALRHLQAVVQRPDIQFFAAAVAATVLSRMGRQAEAVAALRRGTEIEPLASAGWLMLGRALESAADTTGAVASYQRYLALSPRGDAARANVTASLGRLGARAP